jgi:phage terminase large subunit
MTAVNVELPPKLIPVFAGEARYRGAFGGRGSAKTRSFAKMSAVRGLMFAQADVSGLNVCAREFMNSLADSSFAEVKAAIESEPWLKSNYEIGRNFIRTKCGRVEYAFIGLRHNLESIKSKSRILILWADEAEQVSEQAWIVAVPTVREHNSEIWVTWNPARKTSATHKRFRENPPEGAKIVELNYTDNPWFPKTLETERLDDLEKRPEHYAHIWGGGFASVEGAYFARALQDARKEGRIGRVGKDPLMQIRSYHDIGGAGATADAYTIWICQFIGNEIRVLDYYESVGQTLEYHVRWMRERGWSGAEIVLPHDGTNTNNVTGKKYVDHWREAGFSAREIPNQGRGAAKQRIEAVRRLFPQIWFNQDACEAGLEALAFYHEKRDDAREIGLGPNHDWASHAADAFGLMAIDHRPPSSMNLANFRRMTVA